LATRTGGLALARTPSAERADRERGAATSQVKNADTGSPIGSRPSSADEGLVQACGFLLALEGDS
jgi:hypothetical protein